MNQREGEDWLKERYNHITGTDIGKALGINPHCSRIGWALSKITKQEKEPEGMGKDLMELGKEFEIVAFNDLAYRMVKSAITCEEGGLIVDKTNPVLAGTPDVVMSYEGKPLMIGELKCHFYPIDDWLMASPQRELNDVNPCYFLQVQHYLRISGLSSGVLFSWTLFNGVAIWSITYDKILMDSIYDEILKHWKCIVQLQKAPKSKNTEDLEGICKKSFRLKSGEKASWQEAVKQSMEAQMVRLSPN